VSEAPAAENRPINHSNNSSAYPGRTNEVEKGQLDNREAEMMKVSPLRAVADNVAKVAPVEAARHAQPHIPNFQPKQFVPGDNFVKLFFFLTLL
jgi:hypothetical protein